jgi:cytochrome P450
VITLTTFADARQAFRARELRQALYDEGERLMRGVIVNLHGDAHIARRRLENRLFRRDTFGWYERQRIPEIVSAVLAPAIADGRGDLLPLARRTMMTLSIDVAGVDVPEDRFDHFYALMNRLARASTVAHAVGDKQAVIADGDEALATFETEYFAASLARRRSLVDAVERGELDEDALPLDVLTTLLRNQDRLELTPAEVLREIAYYPWVGSHSTSAQLVHSMHHLFEWIAEHPDDRRRLTDDDALRQRFVHESLRLHPASPVALRIATVDTELASGAVLPAGATVVIDVERANRDPEVFGDDPDRFDPFRRIAEGVAPWGLSFGHGTHACLGQELAGGMAPDDVHDRHLLGAVTLMSGAMLAAGARPDPSAPPQLDPNTTRVVWGTYPVLFAPA